MQKRTLLSAFAAATVAATAIPGIAFAQDPVPTPPTPTPTPAPTPTPTPAPTQRSSAGDVERQPSFTSLIAALNNTAAQTEKLAAKTDLTAENVKFVNVDELLPGNDSTVLDSALTRNETDITTLRTKLAAHEGMKAVLTTATTTPTTTAAAATPITADDIIAVDVQDEGQVVVYYRKKQS